ncbi:MAG: hypothetical protein MJK04_37300, partial [Psychrosphaera sp.]|nr:hypothetical protein [Psychrosphaera sp.]
MVNIPTPLRQIDNLRPQGQFTPPATLNLRWDQHYQGTYTVYFKLASLPFIKILASNGVSEVVLTNSSLVQLANQQFDGMELSLWLAELAGHPASPVGDNANYNWKVAGISPDFEPLPTSEEATLTNACHILKFAYKRGVNQGPLIEWETQNCEQYSTRVYATTLPGTTPDPQCAMTNGVFSGLKQGPRRAHFLFNGYNYEDVILAQQPDLSQTPTWTGPKQCPPLAAASFALQVFDANENMITSRAAIQAHWTGDPNACQIRNFYVNHGYTDSKTGQSVAPKVDWEVINCSSEKHVEVKLSSLDTSVPLECDLSGHVLSNDYSGSLVAEVMKDPNPNANCSTVQAARFEIEIRENA